MIEVLLVAERMLAAGELDHAERLFTQVAEADPRNAIAVVGLARVAVERGDNVRSIDIARRALAIDPENVMARRLAQPGAHRLAQPGAQTPSGAPARRSWWDRVVAFLRRD